MTGYGQNNFRSEKSSPSLLVSSAGPSIQGGKGFKGDRGPPGPPGAIVGAGGKVTGIAGPQGEKGEPGEGVVGPKVVRKL